MFCVFFVQFSATGKTHIRFLIENAGSMHYDHFAFIRACLGLSHITRDKMTWCTSKISPAKRLRLFFQNNIHHDTVDSQALCQEDLQWPPIEDLCPSMIKGNFATFLSNLSCDPLKSLVTLLFATLDKLPSCSFAVENFVLAHS